MKILSIETSCDETAAAVVEINSGRFNVLANIVSSQVKIHARYGGIVPEVAARLHIEKIIPIINKALKGARMALTGIDYIAVCSGPGLISSLMVGVETAKSLAYACRKPLIKINHIEGHLFSILGQRAKNQENKKSRKQKVVFPAVGLIVSGGHTQLILVKDYLKYKLLGETRDDAAGEAFDKAAKILGLGYPGGPSISACAEEVKRSFDSPAKTGSLRMTNAAINVTLPRPMIHSNDFDFSFAGLKTAVLYAWNDIKKKLTTAQLTSARPIVANEFQQAIIDVLIAKTLKSAKKFNAKTIILGGGVTANKELRRQFIAETNAKNIKLVLPPIPMTGDNAVMIGIAAHYHITAKDFVRPFKLTADPEWELT